MTLPTDVWNQLETVKRRSRAATSTPSVTIQRGGTLGLNEAAMVALGHPERVLVMVRRDPPILGIRPSDEDPDAYAVQNNNRGAIVNARTAVARLGIDYQDAARRYAAEVVEGGLIVDLSKPGIVVSRGIEAPDDMFAEPLREDDIPF